MPYITSSRRSYCSGWLLFAAAQIAPLEKARCTQPTSRTFVRNTTPDKHRVIDPVASIWLERFDAANGRCWNDHDHLCCVERCGPLVPSVAIGSSLRLRNVCRWVDSRCLAKRPEKQRFAAMNQAVNQLADGANKLASAFAHSACALVRLFACAVENVMVGTPESPQRRR
jgi:hypothetical protein